VLEVAKARELAWEKGLLKWICRGYQRDVYDQIHAWIADPQVLKACLNISRRWGKTFVLCLVAVEVCLRKSGAQVRFAAPTGLEMRKRTLPIMRVILRTCPAHLKPKWNGQDKCWTFPNGSQIHIAGVNDGHAEDLRGAGCDLAIVDEGGFVDELGYLVGSVLLPMTLEERGTLIGSSTPPRTLAHDYYSFATECMATGNYLHRDIYSTGRDEAEIAIYAKESGGYASTTFKREFGAQFVVDEELQIIPEWNAAYARSAEPSEYRRFWANYEAMDLGETKRDFTAVLFGHYNFLEARLYIEDEIVDDKTPRMTIDQLAIKVKARERELWSVDGETPPIKLRIADNNNPELLVDMSAKYSLPFYPTSKDELLAMVSKLRIWVNAGRVVVDPRCTHTLLCLERGIWKDEANINKDFLRSSALGHLDGLAALIYLVRNIDESTNPVPWDYGIDRSQTFISPRMEREHQNASEFKKMFPRRRVAMHPMKRAA
jgi:hypothetical protein